MCLTKGRFDFSPQGLTLMFFFSFWSIRKDRKNAFVNSIAIMIVSAGQKAYVFHNFLNRTRIPP